MSFVMPRRAQTQKNGDKVRLQICRAPRSPSARGIPSSSSHGQEGAGANGISLKLLATNIPQAL